MYSTPPGLEGIFCLLVIGIGPLRGRNYFVDRCGLAASRCGEPGRLQRSRDEVIGDALISYRMSSAFAKT